MKIRDDIQYIAEFSDTTIDETTTTDNEDINRLKLPYNKE